jgi:hypothetical protein
VHWGTPSSGTAAAFASAEEQLSLYDMTDAAGLSDRAYALDVEGVGGFGNPDLSVK